MASVTPSTHDHEAVLGEAADERVGAHGGDHTAGGLAHEAVARGVPQGVGDHGDALEADEQHGDGGAVERRPPEGGVEVGGEQHPVRELGELVVGGAVLELALGVGVVGHGADEPEDLAVLTVTGARRQRTVRTPTAEMMRQSTMRASGLANTRPATDTTRSRSSGWSAAVTGRPATVGSSPISSWRSRFT